MHHQISWMKGRGNWKASCFAGHEEKRLLRDAIEVKSRRRRCNLVAAAGGADKKGAGERLKDRSIGAKGRPGRARPMQTRGPLQCNAVSETFCRVPAQRRAN